MKLYVKKIWTLNPIGYKYVPLEKAIADYEEWITNCSVYPKVELSKRKPRKK